MTKNYKSNFLQFSNFRWIIMIGLLLGFAPLKAQLSGTVSVGTGGTYTTYEALATAIANNGIGTGGLTVNVVSNLTSTNSVSFSQNATNPTTSTKPIKINGGGYVFFNSNANVAFDFNGMDYLTVENLTIDKTGTGAAQSVIIFRAGADYNTLEKCTLQYSGVTLGSTAGGAYIAFTNSTTSVTVNNTTIHNGSYNTVNNCLMRTTNANAPGPTYGITVRGGTSVFTNTPSNNNFTNNRIQNFFFYGIYMYYTNGDQFLNNDISRDNAASNNANTSIWMSHAYYTYGTNRATRIDGNSFHDLPFKGATTSGSGSSSTVFGFYGFYNYGSSTRYFSFSKNKFFNIVCSSTNYSTYMWYNSFVNMSGNTVRNWRSIGTGAHYGFYTYYTYDDFIFSDNLYCDNFTKATTYMTYHYFPNKVTCKGNKFINNTTADGNTSTSYGLFVYKTNSISVVDEITDNIIDSNNIGATGYLTYLYYINGLVNRNQISNNRLFNLNNSTANGYMYCLFLPYFLNMQCNNNLVVNNAGNYGAFGFYAYSYVSAGLKAEVRQNTIQIDCSKSNYNFSYGYGIYFYPYYHTDLAVSGNIVDIQNVYGAYPAYTYCINGASAYKQWDYNSYFVRKATVEIWYSNLGNSSNYSGWINQGLCGPNEKFVNPKWISPSTNNYRSLTFENQNNVDPIASLWPTTNTTNALDLYGKDRNKYKSDRGAIENFMNIIANSTDYKVGSVICSGTEIPANIYVKNMYADTVYGFNVAYSVNNGPKLNQFVKSKIAPDKTERVDFALPIKKNQTGPTVIRIFVDAFDDNLKDDTLSFKTTVLPSPGGSKFTASSKSTAALYQSNKSNDVIVINQPAIYNLTAPRAYANADFNSSGSSSGWQVSVSAFTNKGKRAISGASFTAPSSSADLEVQFKTSDSTLEDTLITLAVKFTDNVNGCDTILRRNILIYPSIKPDFTFPSKICDGELVLFENKSTVRSGNMEFLWDFGTKNPADTSRASEPVFTFPKNGSYDVKLIAKTLPYGFAFAKTLRVLINEIPNVQFTRTNACEGQNLTVTNNTTPTNALVKWEFGDGKTSNNWSPSFKYAKAGSYTVKLTATLNGCDATISKRVYQFDKPSPKFDLIGGSCDNETFKFQNKSTIASGLLGYTWDFDNDSEISTDLNPEFKFSKPGKKMVKLVTTSEFGCEDSLVRVVTVKESPKVSFIQSALCSVKPTQFTNTTPAVTGTIASYSWNFGDGITSSQESPEHSWNSKLGPKTIKLQIMLDNGCSESISKDLVVLTQPVAAFQAKDVCAGDAVVFENKSTWNQGDISYRWDFGDATTSIDAYPVKKYQTSVTLTPNVTLYAYIKGGCADSVTQKITINETPRTCDFVAEPSYSNGYYGFTVQPLSQSGVMGGQDGVEYLWKVERIGSKKADGTKASAVFEAPGDGSYKIVMRAKMTQTGCECSKTKTFVMDRASFTDIGKQSWNAYPNPTPGQVTLIGLSIGKATSIKVFDASGKVVWQESMVSKEKMDLNLSNLSNGLYMISINQDNQTTSRKLVINH